jgi:hypothetical protein
MFSSLNNENDKLEKENDDDEDDFIPDENGLEGN